jgi:hypothetical protein
MNLFLLCKLYFHSALHNFLDLTIFKSSSKLCNFYDLFHDAVSGSDYIASNGKWLVINELEGMWKEEIVA